MLDTADSGIGNCAVNKLCRQSYCGFAAPEPRSSSPKQPKRQRAQQQRQQEACKACNEISSSEEHGTDEPRAMSSELARRPGDRDALLYELPLGVSPASYAVHQTHGVCFQCARRCWRSLDHWNESSRGRVKSPGGPYVPYRNLWIGLHHISGISRILGHAPGTGA